MDGPLRGENVAAIADHPKDILWTVDCYESGGGGGGELR